MGNPALLFNHLKEINHLSVLLLFGEVHSFRMLKNEKMDNVRFIAGNFKTIAQLKSPHPGKIYVIYDTSEVNQ